MSAAETHIDPVLAYLFAREHGVVLLQPGDQPLLGVREGARPESLLEARRAFGVRVSARPMKPSDFDRRLSELYSGRGLDSADLHGEAGEGENLRSLIDGIPQTEDLLDSGDSAPVVRLINGLIAEAVKRRASDIHIEPFEDRLAIRFRIDGVLREVLSPSRRLAAPLASRVKVMARLDIAETRTPQDGRISITLGGHAIDVRVSTLPSRYGERVVLRLLDKEQARLDLGDLGMDAPTLTRLRRAIRQPNGIVLVTGPTGSGKTTTLYAALTELNDRERNILTVEDPIEYGLDGVSQTQVNPKVGMTFAAGLRAILRQDPEIVMVGEIRDAETARIAVQASLTGHLVLSTVHTNSAASAVTRLRDMGVEPFLLASTMSAVLAQRLVRRLCPACKEPQAPHAAELALLSLPPGAPSAFARARGCLACGGTGYQGRTGIYELIVVDDALRPLIHGDAREQEIEAQGLGGAHTLLESGSLKAAAGETSIEEILRACRQKGEADGDV
jgi:general secretion pathway protein E